MKKFIAAAIVAVALVLALLPISMGFVAQGYLTEFLRELLPTQLKAPSAPFKIESKSYERGLFGAKALSAIAYSQFGSTVEIFEAETDLSFGWRVSSSFPYFNLVKAHTVVSISQEALKQDRDLANALKDGGKILEGDIYFTPGFGASGDLALPEIDADEVQVKKGSIKFEVAGKDNVSLNVHLPLISYKGYDSFKIEEVRLTADGNLYDMNGESQGELTIKSIEFDEKLRVDGFKIVSSQKISSGVSNAYTDISAQEAEIIDAYSEIPVIEKPVVSFALEKLERKALADFSEKYQAALDSDSPDFTALTNAVQSLFNLFDKGAVLTTKINFALENKPADLVLKITTDPNVKVPDLASISPDALLQKFVVDATLSAHNDVLELLEAPIEVFEQFESEGYITN
ncbi:MAG: YdgA family protein, partial [Helicobacteraceae bacterium]|nr:YdgA family protein [Helicobacteraceae bacterium]